MADIPEFDAPTDATAQSVQLIQRAFRQWTALRGIKAAAALRFGKTVHESAVQYAATTIQATWRGHSVRCCPSANEKKPDVVEVLQMADAQRTAIETKAFEDNATVIGSIQQLADEEKSTDEKKVTAEKEMQQDAYGKKDAEEKKVFEEEARRPAHQKKVSEEKKTSEEKKVPQEEAQWTADKKNAAEEAAQGAADKEKAAEKEAQRTADEMKTAETKALQAPADALECDAPTDGHGHAIHDGACQYAATALQEALSSWPSRPRLVYHTSVIINVCHGFTTRRLFARLAIITCRNHAFLLKRVIRGFLSRLLFARVVTLSRHVAVHDALLHIQPWYRGHLCRCHMKNRRSAAILIQQAFRDHARRQRPVVPPVVLRASSLDLIITPRRYSILPHRSITGPLERTEQSTPELSRRTVDPFRGLAYVCSNMPQLRSDHVDVQRSQGSPERLVANTESWQQVVYRDKMLADIRAREAKHQKLVVAAKMIQEQRAAQSAAFDAFYYSRPEEKQKPVSVAPSQFLRRPKAGIIALLSPAKNKEERGKKPLNSLEKPISYDSLLFTPSFKIVLRKK